MNTPELAGKLNEAHDVSRAPAKSNARKMTDHRQHAAATLRNRDFILDVLREVLPMRGVILEIASGSGEHVVHFARNLPSLAFQPSDPDPDALRSIAAWTKAVRAPIVLDASHQFGRSLQLTG